MRCRAATWGLAWHRTLVNVLGRHGTRRATWARAIDEGTETGGSPMNSYHYAAWVVFDLRLFAFVSLISLFLSLGVVALFFKGRNWHEYLTAFVGVFVLVLVVTVFVFNQIAAYPVFLVEDVFQFP
jgi:hypothetical protein